MIQYSHYRLSNYLLTHLLLHISCASHYFVYIDRLTYDEDDDDDDSNDDDDVIESGYQEPSPHRCHGRSAPS